MKRPLALVGFTYLLTQAVSVCCGTGGALVLGAVCLLAGLLLCCRKEGRRPLYIAAAFTAAAACLLFVVGSVSTEHTVQRYGNCTVQLSGTVCQETDFSAGHAVYTLRVESCGGRRDTSLTGRQICFTAGEGFSAEQYDRVSGTLRLTVPNGNGGFFSRKNTLLAQGTVLQGYFYTFKPYHVQPPSAHEIPLYARLRRALLESFADHLPQPQSALVSGILVGEKQNLPQDIRTAFRNAGVSHLTSVSGLHMAAAAQLLLFLLQLLPLTRRVRCLLAGGGVVLFMGMTGCAPSVLRSGFMYLVLLGGGCCLRRADSLTSLGFAVLLLCFANPWAAADTSLLLSFSATLGLLLCSPALQHIRRVGACGGVGAKFAVYVLETLVLSLAAAAFTLPVTLLQFDQASLVSPLTNLMVLVPSAWMIYGGFLAAAVGCVPLLAGLSWLLWQGTDVLARYLIWSTQCCAALPCATLPVNYRFVRLWLAVALLLFGLACVAFHSRARLPLRQTALSAAILLFAFILVWKPNVWKLKVTVAASGEGVSTVLTCAGHGAVVGFGADSGQTERILHRFDVRKLDAAVLLSLSNRESQQAAKVVADWHPARVLLPPGTWLDGSLQQALTAAGSHCYVADSQTQILLWQHRVRLHWQSGAVQLQAAGLPLLLCGEDADFSAATPAFLKNRVLVCGALPRQAQRAPAAVTVLCDYPHTLTGYSAAVRGVPVLMAGQQDLVLEPTENGNADIRRND